MKIIFTTLTACALIAAICGTTMAQMPAGCANCQQNNDLVQKDQFRAFQESTIDLRQEMMLKRFALQRENLKGVPDRVKIAGLRAEIVNIQAKIRDIRLKSDLPDTKKMDGECSDVTSECSQMNGMGGCNTPSGRGGCNGGPCGQP